MSTPAPDGSGTPTTASGGRHPSLWIATTPATDHPALTGDLTADVAVVGAGITGLTAAALLAEAGLDVVVIEARRIATGGTGNTTAKVTALQGLTLSEISDRLGADAARVYAAANVAGRDLIARLAEERRIGCDLHPCPAFTHAETPEGLRRVEAEVAAARDAGLPVRLETRTDLPFPVTGAARLDDQFLIHPRRYCLGLAADLAARGVRILERTRVTDLEFDGDGCRLRAGDHTVRAGRAVIATLLPFPLAGAFFARAYPSRSYALSARLDGEAPWGMYLGAETPTRSVRPHPGDGGGWLVVEGDAHPTGQDEDTRRHHEEIEAWARRRFPVAEVVHRWSAQDYTSADGVPLVGAITPGADRVLVATGFRKWGMTNGSAAAIMLADLALGRPNPWLEVFTSSRLNPGASLEELVRENTSVAARFVGDRIASALRRTSAEDLAPGEAGIIGAAGGKAAAYRDADGVLHAVSPVCTHMGCEVRWNTAELTWDCPCHGSRFELDGTVIEGPATRDLERREV